MKYTEKKEKKKKEKRPFTKKRNYFLHETQPYSKIGNKIQMDQLFSNKGIKFCRFRH